MNFKHHSKEIKYALWNPTTEEFYSNVAYVLRTSNDVREVFHYRTLEEAADRRVGGNYEVVAVEIVTTYCDGVEFLSERQAADTDPSKLVYVVACLRSDPVRYLDSHDFWITWTTDITEAYKYDNHAKAAIKAKQADADVVYVKSETITKTEYQAYRLTPDRTSPVGAKEVEVTQ